jgi:hypothetical protein
VLPRYCSGPSLTCTETLLPITALSRLPCFVVPPCPQNNPVHSVVLPLSAFTYLCNHHLMFTKGCYLAGRSTSGSNWSYLEVTNCKSVCMLPTARMTPQHSTGMSWCTLHHLWTVCPAATRERARRAFKMGRHKCGEASFERLA